MGIFRDMIDRFTATPDPTPQHSAPAENTMPARIGWGHGSAFFDCVSVRKGETLTMLATEDALAEVERFVAEGCNGVPFAKMTREGRLDYLGNIRWQSYIAEGLDPDTVEVILSNAADGRPPREWLEPRAHTAVVHDSGYEAWLNKAAARAVQQDRGQGMERD